MSHTGLSTFFIVKGILASMNANKLTASVPNLHNALYQIARTDKFKKYFTAYFFESKGAFRFSREFQSDLINLELAGQLSMANPDFLEFELKEKLRTTFDQFDAKSFSQQAIKDIQSMAKMFQANLP